MPYGTNQTERVVMARSLSLLFAAGGLLVLLTVALPHAADASEVGLVVPPLLAFVVAAGLLRFGPVLSVRELQVTLFAGSVLITACVAAAGNGAAAYPTLYLLVSSYAFFFFSQRAALAQLGLSAGLYGAVLLASSGTRVEAGTWVMVVGTIAVGGALVGRMVAAVRAQAADAVAISQMAGGSDAAVALRATCDGVVRSLGADVAIMLQPAGDGSGLTVAAMAGSTEAGLVFNGERARRALQDAYRAGEAAVMECDGPPEGLWRFSGTLVGLARPVLRQNAAVAVLAVAWTAPRRSLPPRTRAATLLFAAEASLALDRADAVALDRERQALEINDNIVQGLVVAKYSAQRGNVDAAVEAIEDTLVRARKLISDQLSDVVEGRGIRPGDLARAQAAGVGAERSPVPVPLGRRREVVTAPAPPPPRGSPR